MKGLFYLLVVFSFLISQINFNFALAFEPPPGTGTNDTPLGEVLGIRKSGLDNEGNKKEKKKKGKKGKKNPKSHGVIPLDDDVLLELDEDDPNGDGEGNNKDKEDLKDAIDKIKDIND